MWTRNEMGALSIEKGKELLATYGPRIQATYEAWKNSGEPAPAASPFTPPEPAPTVPPPVEPARTFSVGMAALLAVAGLVAVSFWSSKR